MYRFFFVLLVDSLPPMSYRAPSVPRVAVVTPRLTFRLDPSGFLWFGNTGEYRLWQRTLAGDTLRVIEREHTPVPVVSNEKDSMLRELARLPAMFQRERETEIPNVKPAFERIHLTPDGYLIVQRLD